MPRHCQYTRRAEIGFQLKPNAGREGRTSWDCASTSSTSLDRQVIFLGSGSSVPMIHSTCSPLDTFHMLGPGRSPVTSISTTGADGAAVGSSPLIAARPGTLSGSVTTSAINNDLRQAMIIMLRGYHGARVRAIP